MKEMFEKRLATPPCSKSEYRDTELNSIQMVSHQEGSPPADANLANNQCTQESNYMDCPASPVVPATPNKVLKHYVVHNITEISETGSESSEGPPQAHGVPMPSQFNDDDVSPPNRSFFASPAHSVPAQTSDNNIPSSSPIEIPPTAVQDDNPSNINARSPAVSPTAMNNDVVQLDLSNSSRGSLASNAPFSPVNRNQPTRIFNNSNTITRRVPNRLRRQNVSNVGTCPTSTVVERELIYSSL